MSDDGQVFLAGLQAAVPCSAFLKGNVSEYNMNDGVRSIALDACEGHGMQKSCHSPTSPAWAVRRFDHL